VAFGLIQAKTPWRATALAGIIALFVTSVLGWASNKKDGK